MSPFGGGDFTRRRFISEGVRVVAGCQSSGPQLCPARVRGGVFLLACIGTRWRRRARPLLWSLLPQPQTFVRQQDQDDDPQKAALNRRPSQYTLPRIIACSHAWAAGRGWRRFVRMPIPPLCVVVALRAWLLSGVLGDVSVETNSLRVQNC